MSQHEDAVTKDLHMESKPLSSLKTLVWGNCPFLEAHHLGNCLAQPLLPTANAHTWLVLSISKYRINLGLFMQGEQVSYAYDIVCALEVSKCVSYPNFQFRNMNLFVLLHINPNLPFGNLS